MSDVRVLKTKENLYHSFFYLLQKDDYHQITVEQICREARCSRSTFYMYYDNKNDLLSEIIDEQVAAFERYITHRFSRNSNFQELLNNLIQNMIIPNQFRLSLLFNVRNAQLTITDKLMSLLETYFQKQYSHIPSKEILSSLYANSVITVLKAILNDELNATDIKNITKLEKLVTQNFLNDNKFE